MKPTRAKTPAGKLGGGGSKESSKENLARDPVQVFCRVRQAHDAEAACCMRVVSPQCVCLAPPDNYRGNSYKPINYTFCRVFDQDSTQNEVFNKVGLPLVENLIKGKSGLLFTYGVTGSGKTYTMTGEPLNTGIMPRALDVLFRTIDPVQARRFVFRPDKMNMFDVQSDAEAALMRQQNLYKMAPKSARKNNSNPDLAVNTSETVKLQGVDEDCFYAVFVTYIEVYNNSVFDLLEEGSLSRNPQTKVVREDGNHNMYVPGVTEVEVKSREEALEAFYKGLKRKRMAHTTLNAESSRSHSVFTIRLVQAPADSVGECVVQDKRLVSVRQLSLVDLAGSERTSRTNNTGQRLREAGNINNSLMTLRACLEALRENQQVGANNRMVPYRDAKITHLFKNFFDGEGLVRMIVCVNPSCDDYDETLQVMRFAEVAMEVEVARPKATTDLGAGMTPGRRKANMLFKQAREKILAEGKSDDEQLEVDLALVYSLGNDFPSLEFGTVRADELVQQLKTVLELRLQRRANLRRDKAVRDASFRSKLDDLIKGNMMVNTEASAIRVQLQQERQRARALEGKLLKAEDTVEMLQRRLIEIENDREILQKELTDKEMLLNQKDIDKENQKKRLSQKMANEKGKMEIEMQIKLWEEKHKMEQKVHETEDKIRLVKKILSGEQSTNEIQDRTNRPMTSSEYTAKASTAATSTMTTSSKRGVPVANRKHRRSLSADAPHVTERWVQHLPRQVVPKGTVFQAQFPKATSVSKVINVKDITNPKVSNYCLMSQEQDTDGELETKLYKGNVVPTCGGGVQVILNDVEMLKHLEPTAGKKRESAETPSKRIATDMQWKKPRV